MRCFSTGSMLLATMPGAVAARAQDFDLKKYPDWTRQWTRAAGGAPRYDPVTLPEREHQPPLTAAYRTNVDANSADTRAGKQGNDATCRCIPMGMPRQMTGASPMEFVFAPTTASIVTQSLAPVRRIFADGRAWPELGNDIFRTFAPGSARLRRDLASGHSTPHGAVAPRPKNTIV